MDITVWTPDNWITIAALFITPLVTIAGFIFSYVTNQANIKAKRADIITEKSIEVFREFVERLNIILNKIKLALELYGEAFENRDDITFNEAQKTGKEIIDAMSRCYDFNLKYRIYFPTPLQVLFSRIYTHDFNELMNAIKNIDQEDPYIQIEELKIKIKDINKTVTRVQSEILELILEVQKYIGLE